jgi:alpha-galactosidase
MRTIGLCHEVSGVRHHLAELFDVPVGTVAIAVAGINHLPVILRASVGGRDGLALLRDWLAGHGPFAFVARHDPDPLTDIFQDRLAVKLTLFEPLGMLFGAGDRHVAEFFPGFLSEAGQRGRRYGVELTTIAQREELARQRRAQIERFVAGAEADEALQHSDEQLAPIMAALAGGPPGRFVVNVPNRGQVDNLPREAVVECIADVGRLGVQPLAVGDLPYPAYAALAPHVARQELVVEAALTGEREPALAVLATDPLVSDPAAAKPMLDELLAANAEFLIGNQNE